MTLSKYASAQDFSLLELPCCSILLHPTLTNNEESYYTHPKECQERILILMKLQSISLIWGQYENICIKNHIKVGFV